MITVIPSAQRHYADHGWLQTYWHFSFSDYVDPKNMSWGPLRVFNDDVIQAGQGFGQHPHRDMEIVTWVIDGQLEHQDHLGNKGILTHGETQVMSAGRGILHSEYNPSKEKSVHLIQLWILPRNKANTPRYEQRAFDAAGRHNALQPIVSSGSVSGTLAIDQDATIYVGSLDAGKQVTHQAQPGRRAYVFVIAGAITLNGQSLSQGDQARVADETELKFSASQDAKLMLLDLPRE